MAAIDITCPKCSATTSLHVGQSIVPGELVWWESIRCSSCGCASEADGYGIPPSEIRVAIIASDGLYGLHVDLIGSDRLAVCKILRCDLDIDLADVAEMKKRIPGVVYVGTRTEMEWLQSRLAEFGFEASVVEADRAELSENMDLPQKPEERA